MAKIKKRNNSSSNIPQGKPAIEKVTGVSSLKGLFNKAGISPIEDTIIDKMSEDECADLAAKLQELQEAQQQSKLLETELKNQHQQMDSARVELDTQSHTLSKTEQALEKRSEALDTLENEIRIRVKTDQQDWLREKKQQYDKQTAEIQARRYQLDLKENDLFAQESALSSEKTGLLEKQKSVLAKQNTLNEKEFDLLEQLANAKSGFAAERNESLQKLKEEYAKIETTHQILSEKELSFSLHLKEKEQLHQQALAQKEDRYFADLKARLESDITKYETSLVTLKNKEQAIHDQYTKKLAQKEAQYHEQLARVENEKAQLETDKKQLEASYKRHKSEIERLQTNVLAYRELGYEAKKLDLGEIAEILPYLDQLHDDLKAARQKLKGRNETDLEEELEFYREKSEESEDQYLDIKQQFDDIKLKEQKFNISSLEKLQLQKHNDILVLSNQALSASIDVLRNDINDLIEKQQTKEAFPQLLLMDRDPKFIRKEPTPHYVDDLAAFTQELQHRLALAEDTVLYYDLSVIRKFLAGLAMSHLHIFQGISGTGKTSLVKAFAKAVGGHVTTVPVQAGWRDRDDLVGHYNAFEKRYYEKECLQGMYQAHTNNFENRFNLILLDEMNLSRPEQYFAEFLSALEMREGQQEIVLMESTLANAPQHFIEKRKIGLTSNLWFMGTANHDETTFEFADKTHDRAFIMDLERQVQPKNWQPKRDIDKTVVDMRSVQKCFEQAIITHKSTAIDVLNCLKRSEFAQRLTNDFSVAWGSRFEAQLLKFIPVYMACGGKAGEALDHLLQTRLLRKGKVLGRYDISGQQLEELLAALEYLFKELHHKDSTNSTIILLAEAERKTQGVY